MKKRILAYLDYVDGILKEDDRDWEQELQMHKDQIAFFSHERLVPLLVFMLVGICTVVSILAYVISSQLVLLPLIGMLFVLLVPYCMHYYLLENSVQKMYEQYDEMQGKIRPYFSKPKG